MSLEVKYVVEKWGLPPQKQLDVCEKLEQIGVVTVQDLEFLDPEDDLLGILLPIQARKAKAALKKMFDGQTGMDDSTSHCSADWLDKSDRISSLSETSSDFRHSPSSTDTSSSVGVLSPSQNWVASFRIPYNKFPPQLIQICDKGERPTSQLRREMIRIMCAEISLYTRLPGKKNLLIIANKLASRYPKSFNDVINNEVLGTGVGSLVQQMIERMANAYGRGRGGKKPWDHTGTNEDLDAGPVKRNRVTDSYGCIKYSPNLPADSDVLQVLEDQKAFLFHQSTLTPSDRDIGKIKQYMKDTYILQRQTINVHVGDPVDIVKNEWPLLFEEDHLLDHFCELTGIELKTTLESSLSEKCDRLFKFIKAKKSKVKGVQRLVEITEACNNESTVRALTIFMVAMCFGEDPDLLVKTYEETANSNDIEQSSQMLTPHIAAIGNLLDPDLKLMLVIEKRVVTQDISTLLDGITLVFCSYYVFNMHYQDGLSSTLEFIQRCLVNLNPSTGSKSTKKRGIPSKVLSFINCLNEFGWNM